MTVADVTYHQPEPADLEHIAANLRAADITEMQATLPVVPLEGLRRSVGMSHEACVARVDGVPACVFGIGVGSYPRRPNAALAVWHRCRRGEWTDIPAVEPRGGERLGVEV
jgi:hypothetical protein